MPMPVQSCPKCGAMITPQLARCRQCKAYLHGTKLEGLVIENLLPDQFKNAPATASLILLICLYYGLMIAVTGPGSFAGFNGYTSTQLGAVNSVEIWLGQYWRFVTANFIHANPIHLFMNLSALVFAGALVERTLDRKKMMLIYLASGTVSMFASFVFYHLLMGRPVSITAGASGAISGMIGAAWFAARKLGPSGSEVVTGMKRWTVIMLVFGLLVPRVDNAAHIGGWVVGALLAHFTPVGVAKTVTTQRILSVVTTLALAGVIACFALMVDNARRYPININEDYNGQSCLVTAGEKPTDEAIWACELARRVFPEHRAVWMILASHEEARGDAARAKQLRRVASHVSYL